MRDGIFAEEVGVVKFVNLTLADNIYANVEVVRVHPSLKRGQLALLDGCVMVGPIPLFENSLTTLPSNLIGLLAPHSNFNFKARNVRFHKFHLATPISFTDKTSTTDYYPLTLIVSNLTFEDG
jgi:hypothetical protein